jgi:hypothetical protein
MVEIAVAQVLIFLGTDMQNNLFQVIQPEEWIFCGRWPNLIFNCGAGIGYPYVRESRGLFKPALDAIILSPS